MSFIRHERQREYNAYVVMEPRVSNYKKMSILRRQSFLRIDEG